MDKLPSGSYRVRKQVNGINYSLTFDHKPTQKEIREELERRTSNKLANKNLSFKQASKQYNELKEGTLSDASIREYEKMCDRLPKWFVGMNIGDIEDITMQRVIKEMSKTISPKTVKDRYGYIVAVLRLYDPKIAFNVTLPRIVQKEPYIPKYEEINTLIEGSVGTMFHIPLQLAKYGLRREEICSLNVKDVFKADDAYFVSISKALIQDKNKEWKESLTKTDDSVRNVPIDDELAKEILELKSGKVYKGSPQSIANYIRRQQDALGMEHFSLHKFRHAFCTMLSENNIDEATILRLGGWRKNSDVMRRIYRHTNIDRDKEKMDKVRSLFK